MTNENSIINAISNGVKLGIDLCDIDSITCLENDLCQNNQKTFKDIISYTTVDNEVKRLLEYSIDKVIQKNEFPILCVLCSGSGPDVYDGIYQVDNVSLLKKIIIYLARLLNSWCFSLNWIDITAITEMFDILDTTVYGLFQESFFNGDISRWDTSHVKNMSNMFCSSMFNGDLSKWDVSNVEHMSAMFCYSKFNGDISQWNVSNVQDMSYMFYKNPDFNCDINKWDVSCVRDMSYMFYCTRYNQKLDSWDVSNVENMEQMFAHSVFNQDISRWDVSNVKNMKSMFVYSQFNGDLTKWNTCNVRYMNYIFGSSSQFNGDLSTWELNNVIDIENLSSLFGGNEQKAKKCFKRSKYKKC